MRQEGARLGQEGASVTGEADALLGTLEQHQAKLFLQLRDLPAEGGLGNMQPLGGAPDVFVFSDGNEIAELAQIHN